MEHKASKGADLDSNSSVTINDMDDIKVVMTEDQISTYGIAASETVSIYTTGGALVAQQHCTGNPISASALEREMYIIRTNQKQQK